MGGRATLESVAFRIVAGLILHLEMQIVAGVGMGAGKVLVHLDAEPGGGGRCDKAVFLPDRSLDQPVVEIGLDGFGDQQVGDAGGELDVGGPSTGPA